MSKVPGANAAILAKHLVAELIDLNFDGRPEYFVSPNDCSPGEWKKRWGSWYQHQCFGGWIYRRTTNGFEMLLSQNAAPLKTTTNGYRNLSAGAILGCCSVVETIFKFDGRYYAWPAAKK